MLNLIIIMFDVKEKAGWYKATRLLICTHFTPVILYRFLENYLPFRVKQPYSLLISKGKNIQTTKARIVYAPCIEYRKYTGSIQKLENDRFNRADQEGKVLFMDDDMRTEALSSTNNIKSIVMMEDKIDLERKGKQSVQGILYVHIICFGNGSLKSLHDQSYGFYRRNFPDDKEASC